MIYVLGRARRKDQGWDKERGNPGLVGEVRVEIDGYRGGGGSHVLACKRASKHGVGMRGRESE